jgi:hypothetical protein
MKYVGAERREVVNGLKLNGLLSGFDDQFLSGSAKLNPTHGYQMLFSSFKERSEDLLKELLHKWS